ncbi:U2 small nuclear ribonucleoprotein auxiliary factor 35 kDa subunit-related protein 2-like [Platichthys flesus]|uniref:U2 small nuclear ribonucleoprotein auxiliary factor 35 kDa subunit-related protein 2-like n=1 Tax=Platichthys flesus TaxID=8260 RepID=UPI002DC02EAA|nr:U2 small nuclear ribonucleoprotein auxiliary factor 35 kDa subunit-related protein 2-like [Platichthys flesus]
MQHQCINRERTHTSDIVQFDFGIRKRFSTAAINQKTWMPPKKTRRRSIQEDLRKTRKALSQTEKEEGAKRTVERRERNVKARGMERAMKEKEEKEKEEKENLRAMLVVTKNKEEIHDHHLVIY